MISLFTKIIANNPPSILLAIGGIGFLLQISGSGWLIALGAVLQFAWMGFRFRVF